MVLGLKYVELAPGFAREAVDVYEAWEGKEAAPWKIKELMLVLRIEVSKRYKGYVRPQEIPKVQRFKDTKLTFLQ